MGRSRSSGFTIIELTLAMTFVSVLLISVAMLSIQLTNQYSRGLTLKETTQAGTELTGDLKRTISQAQLENGGVRYVNVAGGGWALCTGTYTYIASSAASLEANGGQGNENTLRIGPSGSTTPARFAKVRDPVGSICSTNVLSSNKTFITADASELLSGGSRLLAIRKLSVTPNGMPAPGDPLYEEFQKGRGYYRVQISISAGLGSELESDEASCRPPSDLQSNLEYCAINDFEFMSRAGSSSK